MSSNMQKCYCVHPTRYGEASNPRCPACNGWGSVHPPHHMCPQCGSMIVVYGGGWRCAGLWCCNSTSSPVGNLGPEPDWWHDGTKVYLDGNKWCAVNADFINLQESPAGFGDTPREAVKALRLASPTPTPEASDE